MQARGNQAHRRQERATTTLLHLVPPGEGEGLLTHCQTSLEPRIEPWLILIGGRPFVEIEATFGEKNTTTIRTSSTWIQGQH